MESVELKTICPWCNCHHDLTSPLIGDAPRPGDATICSRCGEWSIFKNDMSLRKPVVIEALQCSMDPRMVQIRKLHAIARKAVDGVVEH